MPTITAQVVIDKAQIILQDTGAVRWPETELLGWLNDAQREICTYKPDAYVVNESVVTTVGSKQTLPAGGLTLIDVIRNFNGSTAGNAIRQIDMRILDDQIPGWHSATPANVALYYAFDPRNQKNFYLYPPSDGNANTKVELVYAKAPADIVIGSTILVDDIYSNAIMDYVLYRAYSKDVDYAADDGRANVHYQRFVQAMTGKEAGESAHEAVAVLRRANSVSTQGKG
jgi:hypothetical protein